VFEHCDGLLAVSDQSGARQRNSTAGVVVVRGAVTSQPTLVLKLTALRVGAMALLEAVLQVGKLGHLGAAHLGPAAKVFDNGMNRRVVKHHVRVSAYAAHGFVHL